MNQFAFSTGALFPLRSPEAVALVKRAGFDGAELMPQALSDTSPRAILEFEKVGLPLTSIHYPLALFALLYTSQPDMLLDGREYAKTLLALGEAMGTRVLVVHPHNASPENLRERLDEPILDNLRWLASACEEKHILLAMENSPKSCATSAQLLDYVRRLNHPNIKPMVDTTEVGEAGGDPVAFLHDFVPCHLHMSDFDGARKHLPIGEGRIDWRGVQQALKQSYEGVYTLEPSYKYYMTDIEEKLETANRFIRTLIEG